MKKTICRTLCLLFLVILIVPSLSACRGGRTMYELGDYKITEKEYNYLMGMFKKKVLVTFDSSLTDESLELELSSGVTLGDYLEARYREGFEQSLMSLLYAQSLFDELGLKLTDEEINHRNATATAVVAYYGNYSVKQFNKLAKQYGFDDEAMRNVYEMQYKENKVREHILGKNDSKIQESDRDSYYRYAYLRYQTLIINTVYKLHTDSSGEVKFVLLDEYEKEEKERLVLELRELLVNKNMDFDYILLKEDKNLSYMELWEKYSDDKFYPSGLYETANPDAEQLSNSNVLSAAYQSKPGEVKVVTAKRYFEGDSSLEDEDVTIKPGDYFEYGSIFVMRLDLDDGAYNRRESEIFFGEAFDAGVANYTFFEALSKHQESLPYEVVISSKILDYTFASVKANELDYYYLSGSAE